jgi:diadenosine tetraphosphate (Ap4A) HIT family hydrolase
MSPRKQVPVSELPESRWNGLYKVAGTAALLMAILIAVQIIVYFLWPPPTTALGTFILFQGNTLLGFLALGLLSVIAVILQIPIVLALYIAQRKTNEPFMLLAAVLGFIGIFSLISSNPAVSLKFLSGQYAVSASDAQRAIYLAAGEAILAAGRGTAYHVSFLLGCAALVIISIVMLKGKRFSQTTALIGILASIFALGLYVPKFGIFIQLLSALFLWVWYFLVGRQLFKLGRDISDEKTNKNRTFKFLSWRKMSRGLIRWVFRHMSFAIPVKRLRETGTLMAFHHPQPSYPLHILLAAKRPYSSFMDLPITDTTFMRELILTVQSLVTEFKLEKSGYRLITNGGIYQDIPQLHFHLISDEETPVQLDIREKQILSTT